jgi:hypothetical protein
MPKTNGSIPLLAISSPNNSGKKPLLWEHLDNLNILMIVVRNTNGQQKK